MIELIILNFLKSQLFVPVFLERQKEMPETFVLFEKTGSSKKNYIKNSTFAFQSYAQSMYEAASLNEEVKEVIEELITLGEISGVNLNSDYNFTDTTTKEYRYQAVFDITHY